MSKSTPCLALFVLFAATAALASGPALSDPHGENVVLVTEDGTVWTEAMIDSVLVDYPKSIRKAFKKIGLVWQGIERYMTLEDLAAHCGPVLWFSPDEPLLASQEGADIRMPTAFPFEERPDAPVVYYRVRNVLEDTEFKSDEGETASILSETDPARRTTEIDLRITAGIDLDYFFFYPSEEGFGAHKYDVEAVEMKLIVVKTRRYPELGYWIVLESVRAKAHGVLWYDNNLEVDRYTKLPIHLIVEEGKHASCTDKNADGFYSPGYDVNKRVNDAWGVRDVMATGSLYTGGYQSWMAKPRRPEHRVIPPLPEDNFNRERLVVDGVFAPDNAVYELRPFPRLEPALAHDPGLERFVDKGYAEWPYVEEWSELEKFGRWVEAESFVKTVSFAFRYDGNAGLAVAFPLFIVKNFEDPLGGGWLVNRVTFSDTHMRDFSYNVLYTSSASRWIDGYFSIGWEWDDDGTSTTTHSMTEAGIKLRFTMQGSGLKWLTKMTDFWGVRLGMKNWGIWEWDHIGYAVEIGAGVW